MGYRSNKYRNIARYGATKQEALAANKRRRQREILSKVETGAGLLRIHMPMLFLEVP